MKKIVVTGGGRHVGKTTLARKLGELMPDARVLKMGTHPPRPEKPELYLPRGTSFERVAEYVGACRFLVVESGAILDEPGFSPDLVIFLPAPRGRSDKAGSERRRALADLVRGEPVHAGEVDEIAARLALPRETVESLLDAAGVPRNKRPES